MNARSVPLSPPLVGEKERVGGNPSSGDAAAAAATTPMILPSGGRERGRRIVPSDGSKHDDPPPASSSSSLLLALPVDSLHCIASFLRPGEWSNLGQAGRGAGQACREVFRRVRMHGFRCATEIVTAWARGEHSDARELAALYVSSGVPVYPLCLQHSYVTLTWRMGVEAGEMETAANTTGGDGDGGVASAAASATTGNTAAAAAAAADPTDAMPKPTVDKFYSDRNMARETDGYYRPGLTFLEEKCLFWHQRAAEEEDSDDAGLRNLFLGRRHSLTSSVSLRPPRGGRAGIDQQRQQSAAHLLPRRSVSSSNLPSLSPRSQAWASIRNKTSYSVRVHRHLADRHVLGRPAVNDDDGTMRAAPLSLAADFYHPHFSPISLRRPASSSSAIPAVIHPTDAAPPACTASSDSFISDGPWESADDAENDDSMHYTLEQVHQEPVGAAAGAGAGAGATTAEPGSETILPLTTPYSNLRVEEALMEGDVALEVYSAASLGISKERHSSSPFDEIGAPPPQSQSSKDLSLLSLRSRIAFYQRKLDSHLTHCQSSAFDECLLNFWDEFFPLTAGVHFHDGHTPVPRMSSLHTFLSRPCPKSFGIVQCEIERIKTATTKKGVKGRLFPAYQYRLFIRDRREDADARNDTVLMIAKNKGKHSSGVSGDSPHASSSKRGMNNYFIQTPQNRDVTGHFDSVNESQTDRAAKPIQSLPSGTPREVCRLQSNFIGTEFQIFSPAAPRRKMQLSSRGVSRDSSFDSSCGDDDDDDGMSTSSQEVSEGLNLSTTPTPSNAGGRKRRSMAEKWKSRSRRSSSRRSGLGDPDDGYVSSSSSIGQRSRRRSWPSLRSYSKRAIANMVVDADAPPLAQGIVTPHKTWAEEENGVITYTANLLGNRPRIMDVCIPRVTEEGVVSSVWRRHVDASSDMGEEETMMSIFKQLQPHLQPGNNNNAPGNDTSGKNPREFGLMALQNRPPWWNAELGAFVLNFGGRVSVASVKNFQLCDRGNQEAILLQFGRVDGRHSFTMDFQYPLSASQAFAIAISSLQSKISFG
mmetsp:Transcript_3024/g.6536  ORF Transcript_3024/g.6536 Transcript_3024/m.6536 type:complete len:1042 (+) Transcript_3024:131-3256(+)